MRFWTAYALIVIGITKVYAAGSASGEHHASITDLIAPAFNVALLLGVLVWKLKAPFAAYFITKSEEVATTLQRANLKSKEAQMLLESEERKVANLNNEIKSINQQSENDVAAFEKNISNEVEQKTRKLKADANLKIVADKKAMVDELNTELINQVIKSTKSNIKTNKEYQNKVSTKLLQGL